MSDSEMGRELSAAELVVKTVVIIGREDRPTLATVWVSLIGSDFIAFHLGELNITFIAHLREDGTLGDDTGRRIHVWEYLGAV